MQLWLIRHGETDWNCQGRMQGLTDIPLNECGIAQARKLAERLLAEGGFGLLYASPLSRAQQTAEWIGQKLGIKPILDRRLVERSAGPFEGLTSDQLRQTYPNLLQAWQESNGHISPEGMENRATFQERVRDFKNTISSQDSQRIAVVAHGGTLSVFIALLLGLDPHQRIPFRFDNASLSIVEINGHHTCLRLLNDTSHLSHKIGGTWQPATVR